MIRHMVIFKIKSSVSKEAVDNAYRLLFDLQNKLTGILNITGGECHFHKTMSDKSITHGFCIDFSDRDAYEEFLNNTITHPAKMCFVNIVADGMDGIFGFDIGNEEIAYPSPLDKRRVPRLTLLKNPSTRRE